MTAFENQPDMEKMLKELKKLQLQAKLQMNFSSELRRQKLIADEAQKMALEKAKELDNWGFSFKE